MFEVDVEKDWMELCEQSNKIDEVFRQAEKLRARKASEFDLRRLFDEASRTILADGSVRSMVERVLARLVELNLPLPVVHFTSRAVRVAGQDCAGTGFVQSIFDRGLTPGANVGTFVVRREYQWKPAKADELDPVPAMSQVLLLIFRYLKHGVRTNKDQLHSLREAGKGVPVMVIANPGAEQLRSGMDGVDHFTVVRGLPRDAVIGVISADFISPDELACELFTTLEEWLSHK